MPRRPKKGVTPEDNKEALALLDLQKQEHQIAVARTALAEVLTLMHETSLYNFTSAQDRRTLSAAQNCLDSLSIRLAAHVNTVEETVKQKQLTLLLHQQQMAIHPYHAHSSASSVTGCLNERE